MSEIQLLVHNVTLRRYINRVKGGLSRHGPALIVTLLNWPTHKHTQSWGCTSRSRVQVTLCAAVRLRVMEMRRNTDFQIQEVLRLASDAVFWSLCFYEDNHSTGQQTAVGWKGAGLNYWKTGAQSCWKEKGLEKVSIQCHMIVL